MAPNAGFPARRPTAASPSRTTPCPRTQWPRTLASGVSNFWAPAAACAAKMGSGRPRVFPSAVSPLASSFSPHLSLCLCVSLRLGAELLSSITEFRRKNVCSFTTPRAVYRNWPGSKIAQEEKKQPSLSSMLFAHCVHMQIGRLGWDPSACCFGTQKN